MAPFGQLVAVLSLCLLAAVANSQDPAQPPPLGHEICQHYTKGGSHILDMAGTFDMLKNEFEGHIQMVNPQQAEQWMQEVDEDHDKRLTMEECIRLIHHFHSTIKRP